MIVKESIFSLNTKEVTEIATEVLEEVKNDGKLIIDISIGDICSEKESSTKKNSKFILIQKSGKLFKK
jgi:hypothetical protein